ncbi:hypothetical protein LPMP_345110 [Leishmania panamensis]|uniref:Uncharacterized protein n=8 Tax=Viannia TaxID=37616 RepID=A4HNI9_LEIBR|nr:conserved hypothetical protein [Leishmania braziliensis MHOM/BR/75/M2904]XP_010702930.1 hypothetical protein LPMP_345110 [Leishmania panamensis]KAI5689584.1 hypothetical protein MNV84_07759 [Leishmania braziliensis]CCM19343.1 hypothetical protein, conserved [Leishmania guyanensis]AIO02130.1 hypothetical protein LPMP_345110 [Leishmania panamensis]CAJ2480931.1 unnamed protein product [Leishmania braziliensis]CAJ2481192.1 unnamed protein product [Leishmania braziliensis]
MSLLNTTLQTLVVRLRDMSGNVTQQKLHNRVFDAYEAKSLVFQAISPAQQAVMKQYRGRIPPLHPVGQPLMVDSWSELVELHKPDNEYQLLPRRARNNSAYAVMSAICCSAGSPFEMDHRLEPADFKLAFKSQADHDARMTFNLKNTDKVPQTIFLDGLMEAPKASALVSFHNVLTPTHVNTLAGIVQFLREWCREPTDGDRHRQLKLCFKSLLEKPTHLFLGTNAVPGRELLNYAKGKSIFVYAKKGMEYQYVP